MLYGLLAFIFRLSSRRAINRELSGMVVFENLKRIFPELESIPHADTLARLLERINVNDIEKTHIALINQLIRSKKFKKLLISGCLPVAIDGTQKIYRDGELHDLRWLSRKVGNEEAGLNQQYIYVLEANIVFKNGLTIPLLTEYLKTDWDIFNNPEGKQDCELSSFNSINTEKHRGYHYEHAFSYDWNAMQGFHLLLRMAHAVNALSEFTKKLKKWIKKQGCSATLKLIKETIFNPWLPREWHEHQHIKPARLTLQLE